MNAFSDTNTKTGGASERFAEYMRKTLKISLYALSVNKVFIVLMLVLSLLIIVISRSWWFVNAGGEPVGFIIVSAFLGFFMPLIMFQHMFKKSEYDFYAAMPITKNRLFLGFSLAGILGFLIVYTAVVIISFILNIEVIKYYLPGLVLFFTVYCSALLAIMLSKSPLAFILIFLVLNCFVAEIFILLVCNVLEVNAEVYVFSFMKHVYFFTPLSAAQLFYPNESACLTGLMPLPMAVIEFAAAFFLNRIRGNEGNSSLAFGKARYPVQYTIMFMTAFLAGSSIHRNSARGGKTFSDFWRSINNFDFWITATAIIIAVTFILTNMIFENTPRGVFKKIHHMFIFTLGYILIFFGFIGCVVYPNIPENYVPFKSDAAVITVYRYEEKSPEEYNAAIAAYERASEEAERYYNLHAGYDADDGEYDRLNRIVDEARYETNRWVKPDYYKERYFRAGDITFYLVTDKEYIDYLCGRVKDNAKSSNRVDWIFGYSGILGEPVNDINKAVNEAVLGNDAFYNEFFYCNTAVVSVNFLDVKDNVSKESLLDIYYDNYEGYLSLRQCSDHGIGFDTFTDNEEDLKSLEEHADKKINSSKWNAMNSLRYQMF